MQVDRSAGYAGAFGDGVVLGYLLPLIALTLPAGRWLDRTGPRAALLFGIGGFTLSSLAAGTASALGWLVAARVAQGGFAGILFALIPVIAMRAVRPGMAGRASALIMTLGPLGAVSGPALGGLIVGAWGWPWIFYLNLPIGALVIVIALVQMRPDGPLGAPDRTLLSETAVLGVAAAALLLGLSLSAGHGLPWLALTATAGFPVAIWWRSASSRAVRALTRTPGVAAPVSQVLLNAVTISLVEFMASFYLQRVLGVSAATAGTTVLALAVGNVVSGPVGGFLADRWNAPGVAWTGILITTVGASLLVPLGTGRHPVDVGWRLAIVGIGTGVFAGPNFAMVMSNAPGALHGTAGAAQSLARQLGFSLGPALATTAWALSGYRLGGMRAGMAIAAGCGLIGLFLRARTRPLPAAPDVESTGAVDTDAPMP
ncbi:MFS transporter [Actinoallomurus sp. CA-150999]|uniref:MFS transporter n=1 Tax=Actinoallomurus sp. CA-150999 TaxID=3239887 RepID=UPI003D94090C